MRDRSDTPVANSIGRSLGRNLGDSTESPDRDRAEVDKLIVQGAQPGGRSTSCTDMRRTLRRFARVADTGEWQWLLERAGRTSLATAASPR
jgi:hypothetical protein